MSDVETDSSGNLAPQPTGDMVEQWWAMFTMHPAHGSCEGIEYKRDCEHCEAGDRLLRLGFQPYGDGITLVVGLVQDNRRLREQLGELKKERDEAAAAAGAEQGDGK